jgi:hypothetical protein
VLRIMSGMGGLAYSNWANCYDLSSHYILHILIINNIKFNY